MRSKCRSYETRSAPVSIVCAAIQRRADSIGAYVRLLQAGAEAKQLHNRPTPGDAFPMGEFLNPAFQRVVEAADGQFIQFGPQSVEYAGELGDFPICYRFWRAVLRPCRSR